MLGRIVIGIGLALQLLAPCVAPSQTAPASGNISLRVHVAPRMRLDVSGGAEGLLIASVAPELLEVRLPAAGEGWPETIDIPLAISGNVRRFLLRAEGIGAVNGSLTMIPEADFGAGDFISRPLPLASGGALAIGELPPGRGSLKARLRLSLLRDTRNDGNMGLCLRLLLQPLVDPGVPTV